MTLPGTTLGQRPLLQPGAGARRAGHRRVRHLRAGHRPVRDAHRVAAVGGRQRRLGRAGPADRPDPRPGHGPSLDAGRPGPRRAHRPRPRARTTATRRAGRPGRRPRRHPAGRFRPPPRRGRRAGAAAAPPATPRRRRPGSPTPNPTVVATRPMPTPAPTTRRRQPPPTAHGRRGRRAARARWSGSPASSRSCSWRRDRLPRLPAAVRPGGRDEPTDGRPCPNFVGQLIEDATREADGLGHHLGPDPRRDVRPAARHDPRPGPAARTRSCRPARRSR